jgi:hypothetical protein
MSVIANEGVSSRVKVEARVPGSEWCVVATRAIAPGERVLTFDGEEGDTPSRFSVQVGRDLHVSPPADVIRDGRLDAFEWRFLNHSCRPNARIVGRDVVAIGMIAARQEVTFDYNTTEYDMAAPFRCRCGDCGGAEIRGARFLSEAERRGREHLLAGHLRAMLAEARVAAAARR